jgi:hypothetical protein
MFEWLGPGRVFPAPLRSASSLFLRRDRDRDLAASYFHGDAMLIADKRMNAILASERLDQLPASIGLVNCLCRQLDRLPPCQDRPCLACRDGDGRD